MKIRNDKFIKQKSINYNQTTSIYNNQYINPDNQGNRNQYRFPTVLMLSEEMPKQDSLPIASDKRLKTGNL